MKRGYVNDGLIAAGRLERPDQPLRRADGRRHRRRSMPRRSWRRRRSARARSTSSTCVSNATCASWPAGPLGVAFGVEYRKEKSSFEALPITAAAAAAWASIPDSDTAAAASTAALRRVQHPGDQGPRGDARRPLRQVQRHRQHLQPEGRHALPADASSCCCAARPTPASVRRRLYEINQPQSLTFTTRQLRRSAAVPGRQRRARRVGRRGLRPAGAAAPGGPGGIGLPATPGAREVEGLQRRHGVRADQQRRPLGFDLWQIKIRNLISGLPEQAVFGDPASTPPSSCAAARSRHRRRHHARQRRRLHWASRASATTPSPSSTHRPKTSANCNTSGIDLSAAWRSGATPMGNFGVSFDGTYVTKYSYQREKGGAFIDAVGRYRTTRRCSAGSMC